MGVCRILEVLNLEEDVDPRPRVALPLGAKPEVRLNGGCIKRQIMRSLRKETTRADNVCICLKVVDHIAYQV